MKRDNTTLKTYFETGDYPTESQFIDLIDSYLNIEENDAVIGVVDNGDGSYTFQLINGGSITISGGGLGGSVGANQVIFGGNTGQAEGTNDFRFDGENLILTGSSTDRFLRFAETNGQYNGAFFWYEGANNKLHIGVHVPEDTNKANDQKSFTILRSNGFVGLFKDNPAYEFDMNGTFNAPGARIDPAFTNFPARVAVVNPSFGGSRLGNSALQSPSIDTKALNFMADTGQQVNFAIFENNDVMTIRSLGGNKVGVLDFNGGNQADYATENAEATFAATINFSDGKRYVNDVGVQRYQPGNSVVAQAFFDVMINSGGAPRMKHIKTYYDGTTYDVIRTIEVDGKMVHEKAVEFKQPTIGIAATQPNELVTKAQLDASPGAAPIEIPAGEDLNDYQTEGFYYQTLNTDAASGANYPEPKAGSLLIQRSAGGVAQQYLTYNDGSPELWFRALYTGTWSSWRKVWADLDAKLSQGTGGTLKITSPSGTLDIGPQNNSFCHLSTDRDSFYFNKQLQVDTGIIRSYNDNLNLNRAGSATARIRINTGTTYSDQNLIVTGTVNASSTMTATNFILSSDERLKENITSLEPKTITADWVSFDMNQQRRVGVVAQKLEKSHPEFVRTDKEGFKSVAYVDLLIAKNAELEARIEKLEAIIEKLT